MRPASRKKTFCAAAECYPRPGLTASSGPGALCIWSRQWTCWRISCSMTRSISAKMSRESMENGELRFDLAANHGAITYLHPGVRFKLIRPARDSVEKLAHDVAASQHKVSRERTRKTHEGKRGVPCHSVDSPLHPVDRPGGHRRRNRRLPSIISAHPRSQPLRGQKVECRAEEGKHASCFCRKRDIGRPQLLDATEGQRRVPDARSTRRRPQCMPESPPAIAAVETHKFKWTNNRVKREELVRQIQPTPHTRPEQRSQDKIQAIVQRSVQAELI